MRHSTQHRLTLGVCVAFLCAACASGRPYTPIDGGKFDGAPQSVERAFVIAHFPPEYRSRLAQPLTERFTAQLATFGVTAEFEMQVVHPLALGSGIDFRAANRHKSDAVFVFRMRESQRGGRFSYWTISIDVLDGQGRGLWRGTSSLFEFRNIDTTADMISLELLQKMIDESVLIFPRGRMQ